MNVPMPPSLIWINLDAAALSLAHGAHWLNQIEHSQVSRFATPELRQRRLGTRVFLRIVLALFTGRAPGMIRIETGKQGKPYVEDGPQFNLSHSGTIAVLALHPDLPVGVDVEASGCGTANLGVSFVLSAIEAATGPRTEDDDLRLWIRKEAVLKAQGVGLLGDLTSFTVGYEPFGGWRKIRGSGQVLWDGHLPGGYPIAVALTAEDCPAAPPSVLEFDAGDFGSRSALHPALSRGSDAGRD